MNKIAALATNTLATSILLCLSLTAQAQYNPNGSYQGNTSADFQTSAAGAAAAASAAASSGMNAANNAANSAVNNAAASYQQNASAQFLQSSAPASAFGQSGTGYTNDGTLMMGGNKIGNPHQILHDAEVPSFMNITATRYTYTNDPTHGQGTLAQMEAATTAGSGSDLLLNRLYLTPNNPYVGQTGSPYPNLATYAAVVRDAQAAGYKLITAADGKAYVVKTLNPATTQAQSILLAELPNTSQFRAAADPKGGGVGVRVVQNGDAVALAAYLATVKPYDFAWQPNFGSWGGAPPLVQNFRAQAGSLGNYSDQYGSQANSVWQGAQIGQNGVNANSGECWFPMPCANSSNGIGVSFDRGFSYKGQFYIFNGANESQRQDMQKDIQQIMDTQKGQELNTILNDRTILGFLPSPYYIQVIGGDNAYSSLNSDTTYINPNFHPSFDTNYGKETATTQRILAHEFGHSVGGVGDIKRGDHDEPKNTRVWENPIMRELGERERISYHYYNDVYHPISRDISFDPKTGDLIHVNYSLTNDEITSTSSDDSDKSSDKSSDTSSDSSDSSDSSSGSSSESSTNSGGGGN